LKLRTFHYAWIVLGITFLILLVVAGIRATPGVLVVPLEQEFGWQRSTVSLALAVNLILYGLVGPFAAAFMERYGIRRVTVVALLLIGAATGLTTQIASWQLVLLWGGIVGLVTGSIASVIGAMIANRWFKEHRGLVIGILTASGATGQLVFLAPPGTPGGFRRLESRFLHHLVCRPANGTSGRMAAAQQTG